MRVSNVFSYRTSNVRESRTVDVYTLRSWVQATVASGQKLAADAIERREQVWGLNGFQGKILFKGSLNVKNLTINSLNNHNMDTLLTNTYR